MHIKCYVLVAIPEDIQFVIWNIFNNLVTLVVSVNEDIENSLLWLIQTPLNFNDTVRCKPIGSRVLQEARGIIILRWSSIGYLGGADKDKHEKKKGKDRHKCYLYDDEEHLEV